MEVKLQVEAVTPIFISGADQRYIEYEGLRAPSLRGLMRWWFRAMIGGVKLSAGNLNIEESVRTEEGDLWGTTDQQSKVIIRTSPLDVKIGEKHFKKRGEKYLGYGLPGRKCFLPRSKFQISIDFNDMRLEENERKRVAGTLWLMINFGNIGSKNRKGFGSLRIIKDAKIEDIVFKNPNNVEDFKEYLYTSMEKILDIFDYTISKTTGNLPLPSFPVLAPNFWKMKIVDKECSSEDEAIDDMGEKIRKYREEPSAIHTRTIKGKSFTYHVTKDYNAVKSIYSHDGASIPNNSIFGLPHQFQFQSLNKKAVVKGTEHERRASPLLIKIWKLDEKKYVIGLQLFKSLFLPEGKLRIADLENNNIYKDVDLPSFSSLENFLNRMPGWWILI